MAEDRMLSDEILLGLIKANSGGGGGGTGDYNDLKNQPQIGGNTLVGNKTASDLGLVAAVNGKGLSTNDYTNADKAIVGGVTAALAGKQGALTAGDYISIDANNEITVNREIPSVSASYELKTTSTSDPEINTDVIKRVNGEIVWRENYNYQTVRDNPVTIDDVFVLSYSGQWKYKLLVASDDHAAGYEQTWGWSAWVDYTENFSLIDNTGKKLIIKEEMDTAINAIKDGQSINSFAGVETALAGKQDKTDNNLQTTDKTVVGAINEVNSNLTNLSADVKLNTQDLTTVSRSKNLAPFTLDKLKAQNTMGTWSGNTYEYNGIVWTINTNSAGQVTSVVGNGTANGMSLIELWAPYKAGSYIINGAPADTPASGSYYLQFYANHVVDKKERGSGVTATLDSDANVVVRPIVPDTIQLSNVTFYPMVRLATETDPTYEPYVPSVESRIEAVESGLTNLLTPVIGTVTYGSKTESSQTDVTRLVKSGKVVQLWLNAVSKDNMTAYENIAVRLPEGFRPGGLIYSQCFIESNISILRIDTNGDVLVTENITAGKHITALFSFIVS